MAQWTTKSLSQQKGLVVLAAQLNDERIYTIYVHINKINKQAYVGQTLQKPEYRWGVNGKGYIKQDFYKAILKYGWDNFEHIILEENLTQDEANEKEKYYIAKYDSYYHGYNENEGGKNRRLSQKEKDKISLFISSTRQGANNSQAKAIICLNTKQKFDTIKQASEWCHSFPENISKSCKRKNSSSGAHPITQEPLYWCLEKDYNNNIQKEFEANKNKLINKSIAKIQKVEQIDVNTNEILNTFENCREAGQILFNDSSKGKSISRCAKGERNTAYGYKWRYVHK